MSLKPSIQSSACACCNVWVSFFYGKFCKSCTKAWNTKLNYFSFLIHRPFFRCGSFVLSMFKLVRYPADFKPSSSAKPCPVVHTCRRRNGHLGQARDCWRTMKLFQATFFSRGRCNSGPVSCILRTPRVNIPLCVLPSSSQTTCWPNTDLLLYLCGPDTQLITLLRRLCP